MSLNSLHCFIDAQNIPLAKKSYGRHVMSKVPMIFGMMLDNPEYEWILWTDDDTYINSGSILLFYSIQFRFI